MPSSTVSRRVLTTLGVIIGSGMSVRTQAATCPAPYQLRPCSINISGVVAPVCTVVSAGSDQYTCDVHNAGTFSAVYMVSDSHDTYGFGAVDGTDFCCNTASPIDEAFILGSPVTDYEAFTYYDGTTEWNETRATATIANSAWGAGGNDILQGAQSTAVRDALYGEGNNDTIRGGKGDDVLDGGPGDDTMNGDNGNDTMTGGPGNDKMNGDAGDDSVNGGADTDIVCGGPIGVLGDTVTDGDTSPASVDMIWAPNSASQSSCLAGAGDTTKWDQVSWTPGGTNACPSGTSFKLSGDPGCPL
jgi:Ca2+-binding RTX toxin-like protein